MTVERTRKETLYNEAWFKARAFASIHKLGEDQWDYSDSLLLYTPGSEQEYESIQQGDDPYAELITKPERSYLEKIAPRVAKELPQEFEFIDLGPGTANKEQFLFDELKKLNKRFIYRPVDISNHYLELASEHASKQGIAVNPLRSEFEEASNKLGLPAIPRFVSLGLTFTNYNPETILAVLKNIAGTGGNIFVDAQMRDRVDMKAVTQTYAKDAKALVLPKLKLLGLNPDRDISKYETNDGVQMWVTVKNPSRELKDIGVKSGDSFLLFQSLRYTKEDLESVIRKHTRSFKLFDTADSFVGALLKT